MAANVYLKSICVKSGVDWTPLADTSVVVAATIIISRYGIVSSDSRLLMRYRGGLEHTVPLGGGVAIEVDGVDLSELEVKYSNQSARLFVFGQSRA